MIILFTLVLLISHSMDIRAGTHTNRGHYDFRVTKAVTRSLLVITLRKLLNWNTKTPAWWEYQACKMHSIITCLNTGTALLPSLQFRTNYLPVFYMRGQKHLFSNVLRLLRCRKTGDTRFPLDSNNMKCVLGSLIKHGHIDTFKLFGADEYPSVLKTSSGFSLALQSHWETSVND